MKNQKFIKRLLVFTCCFILIGTILVIAFVYPTPTPLQYTSFRIVLALASAGLFALISGFIKANIGKIIHPGGAIIIFLIVYFYTPINPLITYIHFFITYTDNFGKEIPDLVEEIPDLAEETPYNQPVEQDNSKRTAEDIEVNNALLYVLELFHEENYEKAREELEKLPEDNEVLKQFKQDYEIPFLIAEHKYHEALEAVIMRYRKLPLSHANYRGEIAYVTYWFRYHMGVEEVEKSLTELKEKYKGDDISYVWMAIHPSALERLHNFNLSPYQNLHDKQLSILKYVTQKYPDDPFIDHAYYFLHQYAKIIEDFPDSSIIDCAYYANAYLPYYENVLHGKKPPSPEELLDIAEKFQAFITKFPTHKINTWYTYKYLADCYTKLPDVDEAFSQSLELYKKTEALLEKGIEKKLVNSYLFRIEDNIYQFLAQLDVQDEERFYLLLKNEALKEINLHEIERQIAVKHFDGKNYEKSALFHQKIPVDQLSQKETTRREIFTKIQSFSSNNKEELLQIALEWKATKYNADFAIPFFDEYLKHTTDEEEIAKILMLEAFCYRDVKNDAAMLEQYQKILSDYPNSTFADDALAEIGVFYVLWRREYEKARKIFYEVIERFPGQNAVDNSYNWIAWSYLQEEKYRQARDVYEQILCKFPYHNRFGIYAIKNVIKINEILGAYKIGDNVLVEFQGQWLPATIIDRDVDRWKVRYDSDGSKDDSWVTEDLMKAFEGGPS
jgi:tetratricopeptide (TPR) repeat protein